MIFRLGVGALSEWHPYAQPHNPSRRPATVVEDDDDVIFLQLLSIAQCVIVCPQPSDDAKKPPAASIT